MIPLGNLLGAFCITVDKNNIDYKAFIETVRNSSKQGWYPIIIVNPQVASTAAKLFFSNYSYLNIRTGNVKFYVPGLTSETAKNQKSYTSAFLLSNFGLNNLKFDAEAFAHAIDWLETECKGYNYSEGADLILLHSVEGKNGYELEYDKYLYVDLDTIKPSLNRFLQDTKRILETLPTRQELNEHLKQYSEITSSSVISQFAHSSSTKVFIAGSIELLNERNQVRSKLQQINNAFKKQFISYTYEDFKRDIVLGGRQQDYDDFIANEADYVVFIIDAIIGGITYNEFEVAINSFMSNKHPKVFVYHNRGNFFERLRTPYEVKRIIGLINEHNQYYIQYRNVSELGHLVYQDFSRIQSLS